MNYSQALFSDKTKRIAVFSDIHGNRQALDAILKDISSKGIKDVVCNGDLISSSAHSAYVVNRIRALGIPSTKGNHERYLHELFDTNDDRWQIDNWAVMQHEFNTLASETKQWLVSLPVNICLVEGDAPLVMTHAAPGNDQGVISASFQNQDWQELFAPLPPNATLIGSHVHIFWQYRWQKNYFVRTPSAGLPLDRDTRAGYCILERHQNTWTVEECRVPYDLDKELNDLKNSELYDIGGVFTQILWLELKTARVWTGPFFKHLAKVFPDIKGQEARKGYSHAEMKDAWKTFNRDEYPEHNPDGLTQ